MCLILQTLGQAGKGLHISRGGMGRSWFREFRAQVREAKVGRIMSKISQGPQGAAVEEGLRFPPGEPQSDVPTGKSGQSPVSPGPQGLGQMGFLMPKPNALPAHVEPCWVGPWPGTRSTKGWNTAKGLEPGPPEQAVLSSCHSDRPCQASRHRPAGPYTGGLACSLAKLLLGPQAAHGPFGERPCPQ